MNTLQSFFTPTYDQILAFVRRQQPTIIEQPRDDSGRFVSKRDLIRNQLQALAANLTPSQRSAAISRGCKRKGEE